jgi:hypothetical protein
MNKSAHLTRIALIAIAIFTLPSLAKAQNFYDDFQNNSTTQSKWSLTLLNTNNSPYYNSEITESNGVLSLKNGAYASPNVSLTTPYTILGSFGNYTNNAGSSFFLTLRSDISLNTSWNPYYPTNYPVLTGLMVRFGSTNHIAIEQVSASGALNQIASIDTPIRPLNQLTSFSVTDNGGSISVTLDGHQYITDLSTSFSTGNKAVFSTDATYSPQSQGTQISLGPVSIVPEPSTFSFMTMTALGLLSQRRRMRIE